MEIKVIIEPIFVSRVWSHGQRVQHWQNGALPCTIESIYWQDNKEYNIAVN